MSPELKALIISWAVASVLNLLVGHKSQINDWCESRPYLAAVLKLLRAVGLDPWQIAQAASLAATKKLPAALQTVPSLVILPPIPTPPQPKEGVSNDNASGS